MWWGREMRFETYWPCSRVPPLLLSPLLLLLLRILPLLLLLRGPTLLAHPRQRYPNAKWLSLLKRKVRYSMIHHVPFPYPYPDHHLWLDTIPECYSVDGPWLTHQTGSECCLDAIRVTTSSTHNCTCFLEQSTRCRHYCSRNVGRVNR